MNRFDRVCAMLSVGAGAVLMILGGIATLTGANVTIRLPPVVGTVLFFLGWGMCVPLLRLRRWMKEDHES